MLLLQQSGWQDSNLRPPGPKPGALAKLSHTPLFFFIYLCFVVRRKTYYMLSNPKCQHLFSIFFDFFLKSDFLFLEKSLKPAKYKALRDFHFFKKIVFLFAKRDFLLVFEIFCKKIFFLHNKKILTFLIFLLFFYCHVSVKRGIAVIRSTIPQKYTVRWVRRIFAASASNLPDSVK